MHRFKIQHALIPYMVDTIDLAMTRIESATQDCNSHTTDLPRLDLCSAEFGIAQLSLVFLGFFPLQLKREKEHLVGCSSTKVQPRRCKNTTSLFLCVITLLNNSSLWLFQVIFGLVCRANLVALNSCWKYRALLITLSKAAALTNTLFSLFPRQLQKQGTNGQLQNRAASFLTNTLGNRNLFYHVNWKTMLSNIIGSYFESN